MVDEMSAVSPARYENEAEEDGTVRHASDDFDRQPTEVDSASIRSGEEGDSEQDQSRSRRAERVVIRRLLADEIPDEPNVSDGLLVVVEAVNGRDEPVDVLGSVSLMVLTSGDEPQRRIRRWDFDAEEVAAAWQSSALGDGLHLQLPLGGRTLGDRPYELWARVLLGNGQKLLTKQVFRPNQLLTLAAAEKSLENETQPTIGGQLKSTIRADSTPAARISRAADHRAAGSGWQRSSLPFAQPTRSSTGGSSSGAQWTGRTPAGKTGHSGSSLPAAWQRDPPPAPSSGSQQRWTPFE